ncbi:hypothetical protein BGZ98_002361 [Dissophora globulifera]|nr:hypothetical protein BGZ98_002361 [Dissophora globulifera]
MATSTLHFQAVPFVTPLGVEPQDVPWLADLIARRAVRLFDPRLLQDLTLSVTVGPKYSLHTAYVHEGVVANDTPPNTNGAGTNNASAVPFIVAIKQYHRPSDLILEVHQLLITPFSQYTNPLLGIVQLGNQGLTCLIVPYHPLGNLRRYIEDHRVNLTAIQQLQIVHDIASGLEFLHQRGIQHMNLHSANVLISMQGMAILTDFGKANTRAEVGMPPKPTAELEAIRSLAVVFMAPEVLASNSHSSRSEVYALGMIMFELLTGRVAFGKDLGQPGLANRVMFGRQEEIPANIIGSPGPEYEALIKDCWKLNPGDRPHLSGLKSRLEKMMMDWRQRAEALRLQQHAIQVQHQHLHQQQHQAQYLNSYLPKSIAPPTPPLPEMSAVDSMPTNTLPSRQPANNAKQASSTSLITTTQIPVNDPIRPRAGSSATSALQAQDGTSKANSKPLETWTIGQATLPPITQQRDVIPINTRVLERPGHTRTKSTVSSAEQLYQVPLAPIPVPVAAVAPVIISVAPAEIVNGTGTSKSTMTHVPPTPTTPSAQSVATESESGQSSTATTPSWPLPPNIPYNMPPTGFGAGSGAPIVGAAAATGVSWPMPPNLIHPTQPAGARAATATASVTAIATVTGPPVTVSAATAATTRPTPPNVNQPTQIIGPGAGFGIGNTFSLASAAAVLAMSSSGDSADTSAEATASTKAPVNALSFPQPPALSSANDPEFVTRAYAAAAAPLSISTDAANTSSASDALSESAPASADSTSPLRSQQASPSPGSLFKPGRNTMIVDAAAEEQQDAMPTFFNWRQMPRIPVNDVEERRTIHSASSSVKIVDDGYTSGDTDYSSAKGQELTRQQSHLQRQDKVKSLMATVETGLPSTPTAAMPATMLPVAAEAAVFSGVTEHQQQQDQHRYHSSEFPLPPMSVTAAAVRQARESILVIPSFPDPPATLHHRRISNMDPRFRNVGRAGRSQLQLKDRTSSFSSDDSGSWSAKNPPRGTALGHILSSSHDDGTPAPGTLAARGTYIPITSSEDVPTGTPSNCIYSAARNGDLKELQNFLSLGSLQQQMLPVSSQSVAEILDEFEPTEGLPVLCCAAVARKNKYQALNIVLKAGANVEGKEQRGGNTPLHLICETAPQPEVDSTVVNHRQDDHEPRLRSESAVDLSETQMSNLSLVDMTVANEDGREGSVLGDDGDHEADDDSEEAQEAVLKQMDEQDEQEQEALERVKDDSESTFSIATNNEGFLSLSTRQQSTLGGPYYQMKNHFLMKGGLEDQIRLLVLAGSPIDAPNNRGETPLLLLLRFHDSVTALAVLLRMGADPTLMAPFGPGTNPPEIHVDPMTLLKAKDQKRVPKKLFTSKQIQILQQQQQQLPSSNTNDPNHILVMHGSALAHAAYYLRIACLRYLLEHEIECSDPTIVKQAIIACQQSVSAQVNPSLLPTQKRILQILERDWMGSEGRRRRTLVAERTLNRKRKPIRANALMVALNVSSSTSLPIGAASATSGANDGGDGGGRGDAVGSPSNKSQEGHPPTPMAYPYSSGSTVSPAKFSSSSLGAIPTMHLYASEGVKGTDIEIISQHGFMSDHNMPRFQLSDRPMPFLPGVSTDTSARETQDWRGSGDPKSPRLGQGGGELKAMFKKMRNINKRP